ncbi:MAG: acyl-CoA synthetase [Deltaproteobacteria bacterium]|nr:acyl-CoA synthetase [Deltaproteobacteria bacterium]
MADLGFWNQAQANPERLALVEPNERKLTAGELLAACNRLVHGLRARGLKSGDCIATVLPNGAPMVELYLAAAQAGWYLVPINHHLTAAEIAYIVQDSEAKVFVGSERFAGACQGAAAELNFPAQMRFAAGVISGFCPFEEIKAGQPATLPAERSAGQVMNYTSGTTGRPKGVRRPLHPFDPDSMFATVAMFLGMFGIQAESDNVHLTGSPLYHTAVLMFAASSLHLGHGIVLMDKWTPESCLQMIQKYRVTTTHMVPTQFHRLLALPDEAKKRYDVSSLRHVIHAAAPCPVDIKRRMLEWWGNTIYEYYAASEGGGTLVTPEEWLQYPGTVGRAWPMSAIKVFDEAGNECPTGTPGTVYMALGMADFEYHKDKEKTAANRRNGFFTVGDIGYLNEDGYLFLCDRKIDMIISGGVNIYPAEVESVLLSHPKVADAAVFGVPNEDWGEEVKAVIEPAPGLSPSPALAQEIIDFCLERTAKYKCPKSIDFTDAMPRDPNGKLYKRKLRDPYWKGRERAI